MDYIWHGKKNVVGKQKISGKYHQLNKALDEQCNNLHVSIGYFIQLIDFN